MVWMRYGFVLKRLLREYCDRPSFSKMLRVLFMSPVAQGMFYPVIRNCFSSSSLFLRKEKWKDKTIHLLSLGFLEICPSGSEGLWFGNKPETEKERRENILQCILASIASRSYITPHKPANPDPYWDSTAKAHVQSKGFFIFSHCWTCAPDKEKLGGSVWYREEIHTKDTATWADWRGFFRGHRALVSNQSPSPTLKSIKILIPFNLDTNPALGYKSGTRHKDQHNTPTASACVPLPG